MWNSTAESYISLYLHQLVFIVVDKVWDYERRQVKLSSKHSSQLPDWPSVYLTSLNSFSNGCFQELLSCRKN